jgi:hypothetical protein
LGESNSQLGKRHTAHKGRERKWSESKSWRSIQRVQQAMLCLLSPRRRRKRCLIPSLSPCTHAIDSERTRKTIRLVPTVSLLRLHGRSTATRCFMPVARATA